MYMDDLNVCVKEGGYRGREGGKKGKRYIPYTHPFFLHGARQGEAAKNKFKNFSKKREFFLTPCRNATTHKPKHVITQKEEEEDEESIAAAYKPFPFFFSLCRGTRDPYQINF